MTQSFKGASRTLGSKSYLLVIDFQHMCELEPDHPEIMKGVMGEKLNSPSYLRAVIHRGLGDQVKSETETGTLLNEIGVLGAFQWFGEALQYAFGGRIGLPEDDGGDDSENPKTAQPA